MQMTVQEGLEQRCARPRNNALAERSAHASQAAQSTLRRRKSAFGTGARPGPWSGSQDRPRCTADRPFQEGPDENPRGLRKQAATAAERWGPVHSSTAFPAERNCLAEDVMLVVGCWLLAACVADCRSVPAAHKTPWGLLGASPLRGLALPKM
ncbi:hypothetical protein IQ07DRAFT_44602 [Pyrenochaeta sp. DS3sAY3a]|nr:hypothetical protein IQ07DRAFT_44602 [Pyrenochaeta sp. DS3sAY3a]